MTCLRLTRALRGLAVLALAAPAACAVENPGFMFETESAGTSSGATTTTTAPTTSPTASSVATTDTGVAETGTTTDGVTGSGPTSTSSDPSDATTVGDPATDSSTGVVPDTTGGCVQMVMDLQPVEDAFFIAGGTDNQTTCKYYDSVTDPEAPCKLLNFGTTGALRIARMDGGIDAMYAARFPHAKLLELVAQGVEIGDAELIMTVYDQVEASTTLQVGMIKANWLAGTRNGEIGQEGDSSFESASLGVQAIPWPNDDGPRGASTKVADLKVPVGFEQHQQITSSSFSIAPWLNDPMNVSGFVVSFPKAAALNTFGPGFKAMESSFKPLLRVHACMP